MQKSDSGVVFFFDVDFSLWQERSWWSFPRNVHTFQRMKCISSASGQSGNCKAPLNQSLQLFCGGRTDLETRVYWCLDTIGCCSPSWMCKEHREKLLSYSGVPNLCQSKPFCNRNMFYYYYFLIYVMRIIIFRLCICIYMCNNEYPGTVCYNYVVSALQGFRNRFFL